MPMGFCPRVPSAMGPALPASVGLGHQLCAERGGCQCMRSKAGPAVTAAPEAMGNHVLVMGDRGWVWPLAVTDGGEPCTKERQMGLCRKTLLAGVARQCHRHGLAVVLGSLTHHGLVFSTVTCSLSVATFLVLGAALSCPTAPVLEDGGRVELPCSQPWGPMQCWVLGAPTPSSRSLPGAGMGWPVWTCPGHRAGGASRACGS